MQIFIHLRMLQHVNLWMILQLVTTPIGSLVREAKDEPTIAAICELARATTCGVS